MRILIAEDDPTAREIARHVLAHAGHEVDAVGDGAAALDALLGGQYALALIDLQLPGIDGGEVAREVRAALPAACPRLLAFSAGAGPADAPRYRALGFDGCLGKPIRAADLRNALAADHPSDVAPPHLPVGALTAHPSQPCAEAARALLAARADATALAAARALKLAAVAAELPLLAGLSASLERALAAGNGAEAAELTSAIAAQLPGL